MKLIKLKNNKIIKNIYEKILNILGDIKIFKHPFFLVYDPKSYMIKGVDVKDILKVINTGDIVLRYYINYLDSYLIKGTFTHAALYIGNDTIVHSVATGVEFIDIYDFLHCDGIVVLRLKNELTDNQKQNVCDYAISQIGKQYDFFFDFESEETYCCTELVYWAYENILHIEPKLEKRFLGLIEGYIINPDDFLKNDELKIVILKDKAKKLPE